MTELIIIAKLSPSSSSSQVGLAGFILNLHQISGGTPQISSGTSQISGGTSQISGGTSQISGGTPQISGGTPQISGGTSRKVKSWEILIILNF